MIGIIWGLYFKISIVLLHTLIITIYYIIKRILRHHKERKFKLISIHRYSRYFKLFIHKKAIFILILSSILANTIVLYQNKKYDTSYQDDEDIQITGIIISQKIQKEYYDLYQVKVLNSKNFNLFIQVEKRTRELEYGDKIKLQGKFIKPSKQRNYGGYHEEQYLKTMKILGKVKNCKIEVVSKKQGNILLQIANQINLKIKQKIEETFKEEKASILKGLLLGETTNLQQEVKEKFQIANISHILAVSGMHINYMIIGIHLIGEKVVGKKKIRIISCIILILYACITGFSPSIVRAVIMGIIAIGAGIVYRKSDVWNSIAISLLGILLYNPFLITSIGLQLSYLGTVGIIVFQSTILQIFSCGQKRTKNKPKNIIQEMIAVSLASQMMILPILLYHFNFVGIYFILTNLCISLIIGPIIIIGFFSIFFAFFFNPIAKIFVLPLNIGIDILNFISEFSQLPFSQIYVPTPKILCIIIYFIGILLGKYFYKIYHLETVTATHQRVRNLIALFYYRIYQKKKTCVICVISMLIIIITIDKIPKELKIYFVDVGQGDCTFIVTPQNKTILLDGGGTLIDQFDVGKKIVMPYLLDRGYTILDYVIISHFDQDHVRFYPIFITRNKSKKCYHRETI